MRTVVLKTKGTAESRIVCRSRVLEGALAARRTEFLRRGAIVFTDSNVLRLYGKKLEKYLGGVPVFAMEAGEENKVPETLLCLLARMAELGLRRNSVLIALGGGVVGDLGGLAAALYMRGISCIQVPTTLLAQVDSSVGGKTAVDHCGVKNLIGVFRQPEEVLVDSAFLKTLPSREIRCGLGEIVKHGALHAPLFEKLRAREGNFADLGFLGGIVPENIAFKASVVRQDPDEGGLRKSLNLGHTTAHALELSSGLSHGECVLLGLIFEGRIASRKMSCDGEFLSELEGMCLSVLGGIPALSDLGEAARLSLLDKKNTERETVVLTVPRAAGEYALLSLPVSEYAAMLGEIGGVLCSR